tara:strand:+ start:8330 stop:8551 length:222 start_codon:yes stop_codon:yes gene_type:complete
LDFNCRAKKDVAFERIFREGIENLSVVTFIEADNDSAIFKTDLNNCSLLDGGDGFKVAIEELGIQGIRFQQCG